MYQLESSTFWQKLFGSCRHRLWEPTFILEQEIFSCFVGMFLCEYFSSRTNLSQLLTFIAMFDYIGGI